MIDWRFVSWSSITWSYRRYSLYPVLVSVILTYLLTCWHVLKKYCNAYICVDMCWHVLTIMLNPCVHDNESETVCCVCYVSSRARDRKCDIELCKIRTMLWALSYITRTMAHAQVLSSWEEMIPDSLEHLIIFVTICGQLDSTYSVYPSLDSK